MNQNLWKSEKAKDSQVAIIICAVIGLLNATYHFFLSFQPVTFDAFTIFIIAFPFLVGIGLAIFQLRPLKLIENTINQNLHDQNCILANDQDVYVTFLPSGKLASIYYRHYIYNEQSFFHDITSEPKVGNPQIHQVKGNVPEANSFAVVTEKLSNKIKTTVYNYRPQ